MNQGSITPVEATYRVVTPMFCGGADPSRPAELRLPSFKGVLRFWWRALAWARLGGDLEKIQKQEACLFGSTDGGQSRVVMRLGEVKPRPTQIEKGRLLGRDGSEAPSGTSHANMVGPGARYLGYGVMAFGKSAGKLSRPCMVAPMDFAVQMRCRGLESEDIDSLKRALIALGTLGGMGAKSRKGYGSLVLWSLRVDGNRDWRAPQTIDELDQCIRCLHETETRHTALHRPEDIPITALSPITRHVLLTANGDRSPLELLDLVGREMVRFRAWGHNGKVLPNVPSERNFKADHDLMKLSHWQRNEHPERVAFGLPHNYGEGKGQQQVGTADGRFDRRASPLFIHIHLLENRPVAVLSLLPAVFLPRPKSPFPDALPQVSVGGNKIPQRREEELFWPVHEFLNRLSGSGKHRGKSRQEPFTQAREVQLQ